MVVDRFESYLKSKYKYERKFWNNYFKARYEYYNENE